MISVDRVPLPESPHSGKRVLLDTMILCYAHDSLSPHNRSASLILRAAIQGQIRAQMSYQNLSEFYSVVTGRRVANPLTQDHAARLCRLYMDCAEIEIMWPTRETYAEAFASLRERQVTGGDVFDHILAYTVKDKADTIWTDNTRHFQGYSFLKAENPLDWEWEATPREQ
jgi:predicted nucleic acid-binding protein